MLGNDCQHFSVYNAVDSYVLLVCMQIFIARPGKLISTRRCECKYCDT